MKTGISGDTLVYAFRDFERNRYNPWPIRRAEPIPIKHLSPDDYIYAGNNIAAPHHGVCCLGEGLLISRYGLKFSPDQIIWVYKHTSKYFYVPMCWLDVCDNWFEILYDDELIQGTFYGHKSHKYDKVWTKDDNNELYARQQAIRDMSKEDIQAVMEANGDKGMLVEEEVFSVRHTVLSRFTICVRQTERMHKAEEGSHNSTHMLDFSVGDAAVMVATYH